MRRKRKKRRRMRRKRATDPTHGSSFRAGVRHFAAVAVLLSVILAAACAGASSSHEQLAPLPTAHKLIEDTVARYDAARSYSMSFRQITYWSLADTTYTTSGVLVFEQPSLLSIRYDDGSRIAADSESLWVYVAQTNQYLATSVDSSDVVLDPPRLLQQFVPDPQGRFPIPTLAKPEQTPANEAPAVALSLRPRDGSGEPAAVDVYLDEKTGLIEQLVAHSRSGDYTRYVITETTFNVAVTPSEFSLRKPPGAESLSGGAGFGR
jgi:outer membrane lipoprotein-sorting protein